VPDVVSAPAVQIDAVDFTGTVHSMTTVLDSSTAAHGTLTLNQGWYTGYLRILDNSALDAGIVRAVRVAAGMTTAWSEYLTVQALQG
jgi:hypothetical protein